MSQVTYEVKCFSITASMWPLYASSGWGDILANGPHDLSSSILVSSRPRVEQKVSVQCKTGNLNRVTPIFLF